MSTPVNNFPLNWYHLSMKYPEVSDWFTRAFIKFQNNQSKRVSITEFGEFLGKTQPTISAYLNGTRKPSYESAKEISLILEDQTILDILGYARSGDLVPFSSLPPAFLERLKSIDAEILKTLRDRGITEYSAEAEQIASEILEKHGAKLISTPNSGKSSN